MNLGFISFFVLVFGVSAGGTTVEGRAEAFALWPGTVVLALIWFHCWRYYLRQRASLRGTLLVVTDRTGTRQCDLAVAKDMTLRGLVFGISGWAEDQSPPVLVVREPEKGAVRLALRNRNGGLMQPGDLALLADAIERTPRNAGDDPQAVSVVRELRGGGGSWTDHQDWSHRHRPS